MNPLLNIVHPLQKLCIKCTISIFNKDHHLPKASSSRKGDLTLACSPLPSITVPNVLLLLIPDEVNVVTPADVELALRLSSDMDDEDATLFHDGVVFKEVS